MKKIIPIMVLATLCLFFRASAQENKAIDVTAKGIQIGQKVPDVTITGLHNYKDANGKPATTAKISDFKGKLLILDFWATWCSPCVAMIPKMDSLQKAFGDKIQLLSVTYQSENEVLPFLAKFEKQQSKHYDLPNVTSDKELHRLFPHITLPHYVWIDENGIVVAITGFSDVNFSNIQVLINKRKISLSIKNDKNQKKYNPYQPLFELNTYVGEVKPVFKSVLTRYNEKVAGGGAYQDIFNKDSSNFRRITIYNSSIPKLYQRAVGKSKPFGWNRTIIKVKDPSKLRSSAVGEAYREWLQKGNGYCYELILPALMADRAHDIMKNDLDNYFINYDVRLVEEDTECFALQALEGYDKIVSKGGKPEVNFGYPGCKIINRKNGLQLLVDQLSSLYMQSSPIPLLNETVYNGFVDLTIDAPLNNVDAVNKELDRYGLVLKKVKRKLNLLVINDRQYMEN